LELIRRLWISKHEIFEENRELAELWEEIEFQVPLDIYNEFIIQNYVFK